MSVTLSDINKHNIYIYIYIYVFVLFWLVNTSSSNNKTNHDISCLFISESVKLMKGKCIDK